ncbi:hypothetical protein MMC28_010980 [Mycoblastus sanguinarius]|nr:hypothetical protein [Mycoblastus sanguinarius]
MAVRRLFLFVMLPVLCRTVAAGSGVAEQCCDIALRTFSYLNKSIPYGKYRCGQAFERGLTPAPDLSVSTQWCQRYCHGYALTPSSDTSVWATPLIQYILPAVIFSMTIPRRLVLEPPRWFFDFHMNHLSGLIKAMFSLCVAGVIVTLDTAIWVFMIMIAPAPFILSGLVEITLDYRVIRRLMDSHVPRGEDQPHGLDKSQRVQLLTAVLAGNLAIEGVPADPQEELGKFLDVGKQPQEVEVRLRAMLACQYPFGAAVGAPILLYIGSFVYSLATLNNQEGDRDTARSLAFGIWWMNIVHVAAISGCLLASNNPSTAAAIVEQRRIKVSVEERLGFANQRPEMEDKVQARLEAMSRLPLSYRARYEPVWMWTRGKSKAAWLRRTAAWDLPWFREKIEITVEAWVLLTLVAFLLVLFPCALAFWIEYTTPAVGVGCRALTILVYTCAQCIFVTLSAWSHFKASHAGEYWIRHKWLDRLRRKWAGTCVAVLFLFPAWVAAIFTTFAGTLMQITGIFQNCLCSSTGYWWSSYGSTVSLATDTEIDRQSSWYWNRAGYTALIFLACVTYLGWWCQRYLRETFIERVKHLVAGGPNSAASNQGPRHGVIEPYETLESLQESKSIPLETVV